MADKISLFRVAIAGAMTVGIQFVLCWIGAVIWPQGPSHLFVALFTAAPVASISALFVGGCIALVAGAVTGVLLAWSYNLTARMRKLPNREQP